MEICFYFILHLAWMMLYHLPQVVDAEIEPEDNVEDLLGQSMGKLVLRHLSSCHLILVTDDLKQSFLPFVTRYLFDEGVAEVTVETKNLFDDSSQDASLLPNLLQGVWGSPKATCRALVGDISGPKVNSVYRFFAASQLTLNPEAKVVLLGPRERLQVLIQDESFHNSIHALYLSLNASVLQHLSDEKGCRSGVQNRVKFKDRQMWTTVYRRCLYCRGGDPGLELLGSWNLKRSGEGNFFRQREEDMQGHKFNVVAMNFFPYTDYSRDVDQLGTTVTLTDSLDTRIISSISSVLNFSYVVREPWDRQWGVLREDTGNWTGIVGTLQHLKADFSLSVVPTADRLQVMEHSRVYIPESFVIVSLEPQPLSQSLALVRPYTGYVWAFVLTCAAIIGVSLWVIQSAWANIYGTSGASLGFSLFYSWGVLLEDPPTDPPPNATGRMALGSWLVFCLVTSSAYRSALIAHLTVQKKFPPINSFEDLLAREGWTWGRMPSSGTSFTFFNKSSDPVVNKVFMNIEYHNLDENMRRVLEGGYSFLTNKYYVSAIISTHYTDARGYSPVHMGATEYPIYAGFSWGFRKGAPYRNRISMAKQHLIEAGLIRPWVDGVVKEQAMKERERRRKGGTEVKVKNKVSDGNVVLSVTHLQGVFFLLFLGHSLAAVIFVLEEMCACYRGRH